MYVKNTKPYFPETDINPILNDIKEALETGQLTLGPKTEEFESNFAEYTGVKHAVAVNSGTSALEIALRYLGIEHQKHQVLVPTNTFVASANAVLFAGGTPVMVDMDPKTLCADFEDIKRKVNPDTKGIIIVHMAGLIPPYIFELKKFCEDNGLFLLEDAAHAHGCTIDGIKAGALGDIGCFSFFPTKLITTGEGGMITTNDDKFVDFAKQLRHHGQEKGLMTKLGYNWRMSTINAIIGIHQLKRLDSFIQRRNEVAAKYRKAFKNMAEIDLIEVPTNVVHGFWKYPIMLKSLDEVSYTAGEFQKIMKDKYNIETGTIYYPPIHLQPYYKENYGYLDGAMKKSEENLIREICLPIFVDITDEQVDYVIECVKKELI